MTPNEAQALHDARKRDDPEHDRGGCWCCCIDCDFDHEAVVGMAGRITPMTGFKPGDRVLITGRGHPWAGHAGEITGPFDSASAPELKWTVSVDGQWAEAAVADSDIRKAREGSRP